jgi:hypothetical protein
MSTTRTQHYIFYTRPTQTTTDDALYESYLLNRCNHLANTAHTLPTPDIPIAKLPNQQATFLINNFQISSNYIGTICQIKSTPKLQQYYNEKFQWTQETILGI